MNIDFEIVDDNTEEIIRQAEGQLGRALKAMGLHGEKRAKEICPVRTGRLRNSITHTYDETAAYIGTNVEYAPYVELGSSRQKPHPYLRPAIENHILEYRQILVRYLGGQP